MAEEPKETKEEAKEPPKKSKKKLFIIIGVVVVILLGAGGYFFLSGGGEGDDTHSEGKKDSGDAQGKKPKKDSHGNVIEGEGSGAPEILVFDPFIVNLTNTAGNRYLKVTINIEIDSGSVEEAKGRNAQIRDSIITLLSSKSYADVGSVSGKYQLRDEIAARVNLILTEGKVKSVYFTEFVIQ
jgi:flagellar FliL protein